LNLKQMNDFFFKKIQQTSGTFWSGLLEHNVLLHQHHCHSGQAQTCKYHFLSKWPNNCRIKLMII
jgi:hypothetical protein